MNKALRCFLSVFDYDTVKIVRVESYKIGILYRLIQLVIIAYIIGYAIVYKKGYQVFDVPDSSVTVKVKGVANSNFSDFPPSYRRIWDTADYIVPPQENNAFFVMTNAIITNNQTQTTCGESPLIQDVYCTPKNRTNCIAGQSTKYGNGIMTGECVPYKSGHHNGTTRYTCEIHAWCPVEDDELVTNEPLLDGVENFTIMIKNFVEFTKFGIKRRNIVDSINNKSYLSGCLFNAATEPLCPIFRLGDIIDMINENFTSLALQGGVISLVIDWNCNLDHDPGRCIPHYTFRRLDDAHANLAPGWNFRYADHYRQNDVATRDLYKAYGILFSVLVRGQGGKFSVVPLLLNIGSGLALLSLSPIICDLVLLYVLPKRRYYSTKKYLKVYDDGYLGDTDSRSGDSDQVPRSFANPAADYDSEHDT